MTLPPSDGGINRLTALRDFGEGQVGSLLPASQRARPKLGLVSGQGTQAVVDVFGFSRFSNQALAVQPLITFLIRLQIVPRWT